MIATVAVAHPATAVIPVITSRPRLQLRAQHCAGRCADDAAGNGSAGSAGRSAANDRAGRATQKCAAQGVVLRGRRLNWDRYRNREQCDGRVMRTRPLFRYILCDPTELFNLVAEVQHHDDTGVGTQSPSLDDAYFIDRHSFEGGLLHCFDVARTRRRPAR